MKTLTQKLMFWVNRATEKMSRERTLRELKEFIKTLTAIVDRMES